MDAKELRKTVHGIIAGVPGVAGFHGGWLRHRGGVDARMDNHGAAHFRADLVLDDGHPAAAVARDVIEAVRLGLRERAGVELDEVELRFNKIRLRPGK